MRLSGSGGLDEEVYIVLFCACVSFLRWRCEGDPNVNSEGKDPTDTRTVFGVSMPRGLGLMCVHACACVCVYMCACVCMHF